MKIEEGGWHTGQDFQWSGEEKTEFDCGVNRERETHRTSNRPNSICSGPSSGCPVRRLGAQWVEHRRKGEGESGKEGSLDPELGLEDHVDHVPDQGHLQVAVCHRGGGQARGGVDLWGAGEGTKRNRVEVRES